MLQDQIHYEGEKPALYRGVLRPIEPGYEFGRHEPDAYQNLVYATPWLHYAGAYGLKQKAKSSIVSAGGTGEDFFTYILLATDQRYEDFMSDTLYIAKVDNSDFLPHLSVPGSGMAVQWASKVPARAQSVSVYPFEDLMHNGMQVFFTDTQTLVDETSPHEPINPRRLGELVNNKLVSWENSRFIGTVHEALACPSFVLNHFGIKPIPSFFQIRSSRPIDSPAPGKKERQGNPFTPIA